MIWWIWLVAGCLLLGAEMLLPGGLYLLFFGLGAVLTGLLAAFGLEALPWQVLAFIGLSVLALALFRKPLLQKMKLREVQKNVDDLVGETAVAQAVITIEAIGKAELRGSSWNAKNVGVTTINPGDRCQVENIEGLLLWIRRIEQPWTGQ